MDVMIRVYCANLAAHCVPGICINHAPLTVEDQRQILPVRLTVLVLRDIVLQAILCPALGG
jgi:hypothetical protein